jgi:hypothetical protein
LNVSDHEDGGGMKKALVSLVPTFLKLSADFIRDSKANFGADDEEKKSGDSSDSETSAKEKGKGKANEGRGDIHAVTAWYDLLTSLLTQACLEGYLVDGWTGTEGIETLFGVGCGVWEGRGWSTATRVPPTISAKKNPSVAACEGKVDEDSDEDDEEEDEEEMRLRVQEREATELVEAAHVLFGSRDVAQADYERGMRDRIHEVCSITPFLLLIFECQLISDSTLSYSSSTYREIRT